MNTIQEYIELLAARNEQIRELQERISGLENELSKREIELFNLKRLHFGQSSEKMKKPESLEPMPLFPEYDEATVEAMDNTLPPIAPSEIVDAIEEETKQRKAKKKTEQKSKQQRERRTLRLPDNLEREVVTLYPDGYDSEKMEIIGKDSTITLERRTQEYYLKEVVRVICINKSEKGSTHPRVMQHPFLPRISEHGYLGDSMIVNILVDKFCHHLPEYRQAKIFREHGLDIPTSTINRAVHQAIDKLYPIYYAQMKAVLSSPYVHMDETVVSVNDRKDKTRKAYLWDMVDGSPQNKGLFFYYREGSRSQQVMQLMLDGYKGAVQTDGYKAYEALAPTRWITLLHCMAHARRKFENIKAQYPQDIQVVLKYFAFLYQIEANLKERHASLEEIQKEREEKSVPILNKIEQWLKQKSLVTTPKSSLGEAISYTLKHWDKLCAYVTNGMYNIDNNPVERSIRPIALGRKLWLIIKNDESGEDLAVISTLIQTCELLGINPKDWLSKTFSKIAGQNNYDPETLLPYHYV